MNPADEYTCLLVETVCPDMSLGKGVGGSQEPVPTASYLVGDGEDRVLCSGEGWENELHLSCQP